MSANDIIERLATCARQLLDAGAEIERLRVAELKAFQMYVDANEALIEAIAALREVKASKMPGESRAIAIRALKSLETQP